MRSRNSLVVTILYLGASCLPMMLRAQTIRNLPLSPLSPRNMAQCEQLQSQWDALRQQVQSEHQRCLAAHAGDPSNPNSGSGPGSMCSRSGCQSLHTELYTILAPQEQATVQQCRNRVAQYQQQRSQNPNQSASGNASTPLQEELDQLQALARRFPAQPGQNPLAAELQALERKAQTLASDGSTAQIPPAALNSSDPEIQAKVQLIQRLDQARASIQSLQADQANEASQDWTNAVGAALLSPSEILKGAADATATAIALDGGPAGKAFAAGYGVVTNLAGQISGRLSDGQESGSGSAADGDNVAEQTELTAKMAEGTSALGEILSTDKNATSIQEIAGDSLQGVGDAAAVGINAMQSYNALGEGKYVDAAASAASAIGGTAKLGGQVGEALGMSGATALTQSGESITAAAGFAQAGKTIVQGASDAWDSIGAPGAVVQQYSSALSNETAVVQSLTDKRNAAYLELLNLLYPGSSGTVPISVPGPTPSVNPAPQVPEGIVLP